MAIGLWLPARVSALLLVLLAFLVGGVVVLTQRHQRDHVPVDGPSGDEVWRRVRAEADPGDLLSPGVEGSAGAFPAGAVAKSCRISCRNGSWCVPTAASISSAISRRSCASACKVTGIGSAVSGASGGRRSQASSQSMTTS